jgi:hypothetical protein
MDGPERTPNPSVYRLGGRSGGSGLSKPVGAGCSESSGAEVSPINCFPNDVRSFSEDLRRFLETFSTTSFMGLCPLTNGYMLSEALELESCTPEHSRFDFSGSSKHTLEVANMNFMSSMMCLRGTTYACSIGLDPTMWPYTS